MSPGSFFGRTMCSGSDSSGLWDIKAFRESTSETFPHPPGFPDRKLRRSLRTSSTLRRLNVSAHAPIQFYDADCGFYDAKINDDDVLASPIRRGHWTRLGRSWSFSPDAARKEETVTRAPEALCWKKVAEI